MPTAPLRRFMVALFYAFVISGILGATLISDDLDYIRMPLISYLGIPLFVGYIFCSWAYPPWTQKFPVYNFVASSLLIFIFSWGNILLLNAAGDGQLKVAVNQPIASSMGNVGAQKGPLGMVYRWRF